MRDTKGNRATKHYSVYSNKHPHIPLTRTDYVKQGGKWKPINVENETISEERASLTLADAGLPFERSHRHEKRDRFGHSRKWDTFSSISPDGDQKTTWQVDFAKGDENYRKLAKKSYYDRQRYKAKKNGGK